MMTLMLLAFFVILLSAASSPVALSPEDHSTEEEARRALEGFSFSSKQAKGCNDSSDCPENQYCQSSPFTAECRQCKDNEMECGQDEECCSEQVCSWGRCTEGLSSGAGGTRCNPAEEQCAPGFCCSRTKTHPLPVCIPLPSEGEPCHSQTSSLLKLITFGVDYEAGLGYCSCSEGLVCSSKGNLISTCEKPDEIVDVNYRDESLFQPVVRREEDLTYYDTDLVPWPGQDDQLGFVDFRRAVEETEAKPAQLTIDVANRLEEDNIQLEEHVDKSNDPSQVDFQELKRLASEMGQYFGAGFY